MEIRFSKMGRALIVSLKGELDHHSAQIVREKVDREYIRSGAKNMVFDFGGVDFMDSSGIGVVIGRYKLAAASGGAVSVSNILPSIDKIFTISGIYKLVNRFESVEEAMLG